MASSSTFRGSETATLVFDVEDGVDTYTLARALTAFADLALAADRRINPGTEIVIEVVGLEAGSVRAVLRRVERGVPGFFADGIKNIFWNVVAGLLLLWLVPGAHLTISMDGHTLTVSAGTDTVVLEDAAYEEPYGHLRAAIADASSDSGVQRARRDLFSAVQRDPKVRSIGFERPGHPPIVVPQAEFARLVDEEVDDESPHRRKRTERATLVILKPSLHRRPRKWALEWNGVPISAAIKDEAFLTTMRNRGFLFGFGDALEVEITYEQDFDPKLGLYKNDGSTFVVTRVIRHIASSG